MREIKSGELFPMEANLDHLKGIDFKKGCFIGQEVTSRMYRKGKVKKRIILFVFHTFPYFYQLFH